MKPASLLALVVLAAGIASASVIFNSGNIGQTDSAVLFNCPTICSDGPATTVVGHLQQVFPDTAVDFASEETLVVNAPGYNAVSGTSSTSGFDDMAITVPGHTFTSIILQLTSLASVGNGTVTFTALTVSDGTPSQQFFDSHTGGNYFTITTDAGTQITELDFVTTLADGTTPNYQDNVSQVRIGGVSGVAIVPEPATYGMVGIALVGLASLRRRRSRL